MEQPFCENCHLEFVKNPFEQIQNIQPSSLAFNKNIKLMSTAPIKTALIRKIIEL